MNVLHKFAPLAALSAFLLAPLAFSSGGIGSAPAKKILQPEDSETGTGTYSQVGSICTASSTPSSTAKKQLAVTNANTKFKDDIKGRYSCPDGALSATFNPDPPYAIDDCTFEYESGCQGNPLKTKVTATCTATQTWVVSCD